ncbi:MAG: hypothetical protein CVT76_00450 [Alphaproteobacteria bacterium HGW-Alphaproteobacteria-15]|nr:MAG: hypothetical protein CVT76_00450 [Alphaproteobacteria bacterium HGW-Alphaproteobacteria-15]
MGSSAGSILPLTSTGETGVQLQYGFGIRSAIRNAWRRAFVRSQTRHLHGPNRWELNDKEVALILLGRDVIHSAPYFLDYYRARGVTKFVYLDNGSQDGSEYFFSSQPDTIVAQCLLNFRDYQAELRYCTACDFAIGGWRLAVDADELLDYWGSGQMNIPSLVDHLVTCGFTGLVAQMLEMVPRGSLRAHEHKTFAECVDSFRCYSISDIETRDYLSPEEPLFFFSSKNKLNNNNIKIMRGGLRRTIFGEECLLIKHVLFKCGKNVLPLPHPHFTCGLNLADFSAVLYHYKFAGPYFEKEKSLNREGRLSHCEGRIRLAAIERANDLVFDFDGLLEDPSVQDLVCQGFLVDQRSLTDAL